MESVVLASSKRYIIIGVRGQRTLLCLQARAQDFVWIRRRSRRHLAQDCCQRNSEPVHVFSLAVRLAHFQASKLHLEKLV